MPSPVAPVVTLTDEERSQLLTWSRRPTSANALAVRSRIVLAAGDGLGNTAIAQKLGIAVSSARKWRSRFVADRLDGLLDEPRPGRPRTVGDEQVEAVITRTLETTPKDATHWSTRSLAAELGLSQSAVSRIWRAFGLQPHRQESWKLSKDPLFVDKVKDVVGLYLDPPERAVVLCVDEKSQIQALDRTAPILPMLPGTPQRATHDYKRYGTSSLYAALDLATGQVIGSLHARHRAIEFKKFLAKIDAEVPGTRRARRARQRLDPQDTGREAMADRTPPLHAPLHPDQLLMAQPGRTLVRRADHEETPTRHPPVSPRTQHRHPRLDRHLERQPQALRVDQDRRPDPRIHRQILHPN
ncbi:transposase [Jiangella mangrovi]|uniref:Transposase n=1 Tax=Jiangella mangrovi TaxID=1524084 RepID=A0A7W9GR14_9ACTN|nr:transposase [Jiangella mangrovi]